MAEYLVQILVEHLRPGLQQKMGPTQRPLHLLLLDESFADHLVDRRLHEGRADRLLDEEKTRNGLYSVNGILSVSCLLLV